MEEIWNIVVNNKDYLFKLVITILGAFLGLIPIISKIKANRTNKVFEDIISERKKSHDDIIKFLYEQPHKSVMMKDYKECKMLWEDKVIPGYFELFNNIKSIEKFKEDVKQKRLYNKTLNYKVDKYLFFLQSYIDTCIVWLYRNDTKLIEDPQIKIFLSNDLYIMIRKVSNELNKFYDNKQFQKFRKIPRVIWLSSLIVYIEFKILVKKTNLDMSRYVRLSDDTIKDFDKKLKRRLASKKYIKYKKKYKYCDECVQKCSIKDNFDNTKA